jgi:hypothetical protein
MSKGQNVGDFLSKIKSITCQLKDLNKAFDDSVIVTKIIFNLLAKYDGLMTTWDNMLKNQRKLENLMLGCFHGTM